MFNLIIPIGITLAMVSGCKKQNNDNAYINDLRLLDETIVINQTTLQEAELYLGDPTFISEDKSGKKIVGFNLMNKAFTDEYAKNIVKGTISFGSKATAIPKVTKNIILELNENDIVENYKFTGEAWVETRSLLVHNEAKIELSKQEILDKKTFNSEYIYERYKLHQQASLYKSYKKLSHTAKFINNDYCDTPDTNNNYSQNLYGTYTSNQNAPEFSQK